MSTSYEILQTLAKEEYTKRIKELNISNLDERLYLSQDYVQMSAEKKHRYLANKVFRPVISQYTEDSRKWLEYLQTTCGDMWDLDITIVNEDHEWMDRVVGTKIAVGDLLKVSFRIEESAYAVLYGYTGCQRCDYDVIPEKNQSVSIVDLAGFLAGLYQYRELLEECRRLRTLLAEEREKDPVFCGVVEYLKDRLVNLPVKSPEERRIYCDDFVKRAWEYKRKNLKKRNIYNVHRLIGLKFPKDESNEYFYDRFIQMMEGEIPLLSYCDLVDYSMEEKKGWKCMTLQPPFAFWGALLDARAAARGTVVENFRSYKDLDSDYARSFMTKKNQSEKLKVQIKESVLWKYFGYVEYDEDVELDAIRQYETEFERFYEKHLKKVDLSKDAVRFRKLGQHHAAGLYYPQVKCLCVDIHEPHSMIHELGHLIDYQMGSLSSCSEFTPIYQAARIYLNGCLAAGGDVAKRLKSKTKYNMKYFMTPTEVFARSFELYAAYVLEEKSSLLASEYGGVYDTSEENLVLIKSYFEKVL